MQRMMTKRKSPTLVSRTVSVAVLAGSGALALSGVTRLARADTEIGPEHPERATKLVTDGPYRYTRNPVYLALAGVLVARAVSRRSARALVPAAAFLTVLNSTQVPAEEQALASRFKRPYKRYRKHTPRWVRLPSR